MKFLSNIFDHRKPEAEGLYCHDYNDRRNGPDAMRAAWLAHLGWITSNIIGPPQGTDHYSVEQLEKMGMIGIYAKSD